MYKLNDYADVNKLINDKEYAKTKYINVKNINNLYLMKYDKNYINYNNIDTLGLFRSVICDDEKIVSFSPPKSRNVLELLNIDEYNKHMCEYKMYEYAEGTMINVFWDKTLNDWNIATRSNIGAKCFFYLDENKKTFRYLFLDVMNSTNLEFDNLNKEYSYSFVIQHPENRIVSPFDEKKLYLIAVYEYDKYNVSLNNKEYDRLINNFTVNKPENFTNILSNNLVNTTLSNFTDLINVFSKEEIDYRIVGCVLYNNVTGERLKIRNKNYEYVRRLKGNTPKIQYQYYYLRKNNLVKEYLSYYPEKKNIFFEMRNNLHIWTNELHSNYIDCFINKLKPLSDFPYEFKPHLYALHSIYLNNIKTTKLTISKKVVVDYVNNLPPQRLMYGVNYKLKKNILDEHISELKS